MAEFIFNVNGKPTKDWEKAHKELGMQLAASSLNEDFEAILKPFESELNACGGKVEINIDSSLSGSKPGVSFHNVPEQLAKRIEEALFG